MPTLALANTSSAFMPQVKTPALGSPRRMAFSLANSAAGGAAPPPPPPLPPPFLANAIRGALTPTTSANANRITLGLLMKASIGVHELRRKTRQKLTQNSVRQAS